MKIAIHPINKAVFMVQQGACMASSMANHITNILLELIQCAIHVKQGDQRMCSSGSEITFVRRVNQRFVDEVHQVVYMNPRKPGDKFSEDI